MDHITLNKDDIRACLELASDGVNLHLQDQSKLDVIHKIMYAVADAVQNDQAVVAKLESGAACQFSVRVQGQSLRVKSN